MGSGDNGEWLTEKYSRAIGSYLCEHLVGLRVVVVEENQAKQCAFTGFCVQFPNALVWTTAGHCLDRLLEIRKRDGSRMLGCELLDYGDVGKITAVPIGTEEPPVYHIDHDGLDLGFMPLRPGFAAPLLANPRMKYVIPATCGTRVPNPTGHMLLGFPAEWVVTSDKPAQQGLRAATMSLAVACFPVVLLNDHGCKHPEDTFWGMDENCIYGRVVMHPSSEGKAARRVEGMSGGLLIEFKDMGNDGIVYSIIGIQSSCGEVDPTLIRATRASLIPKVWATATDTK